MLQRVYVPKSLEEALDLLLLEGTKAIAGGTNLLVDQKKGKIKQFDLVSLNALEELRCIEEKEDGLHIGAGACFDSIEAIVKKKPEYQALAMAASVVGSPQIRNLGTIGGNILSASPAADSVPPLLVLDAGLRLQSKGASRVVPLDGFILSPGRTKIRKGELLTEIILPHCPGRSCFYKVGKRNSLAISILNQAVYLDFSEGRIQDTRIALGSCAPKAIRAKKTENLLKGVKLNRIEWHFVLKEACRCVADEISPIDDIRATKEYRRLLSMTVLKENLENLLKEAGK